MKYKDNNLTIQAESIPLYDTDRPTPALIDIFNPEKNKLRAQSQALITRVGGILHEYQEPINFGIADIGLHSLMPILIYSRKSKEDQYYSLSNQLSIQDHKLSSDLLTSVKLNFYNDSKELIYDVFRRDAFVYLVINIKEEETIFTAIDKLSERKGVITIHNPGYKNTIGIMKYSLDRNIHLIENIDGSADIFRF